MTDAALLHLVASLSQLVIMAWIFAGLLLVLGPLIGVGGGRLVKGLFHELRPLYLPAVLIAFAADSVLGHPSMAWRAFNLVMNILNWFLYKDKGGDDDRWKRRKAKLGEKVTRVGSRLTVVPAGAS